MSISIGMDDLWPGATEEDVRRVTTQLVAAGHDVKTRGYLMTVPTPERFSTMVRMVDDYKRILAAGISADDWLFEHCEHDGLKSAITAAWQRLPEHARGAIRELHPVIEGNDGPIRITGGYADGIAQCWSGVENPTGPVNGYRILINTQLSPDGLVYAVAHEFCHMYLYHPNYRHARRGATQLESFCENAAVFVATEVFDFMPFYRAYNS